MQLIDTLSAGERVGAHAAAGPIAVSIVMPCLNEAQSLAHCVANAREALARIAAAHGLAGEIVIADNGSIDGSQAIAEAMGARVVPVTARGYGAALIGGFNAARGRYLVMGDADGSYDFNDSVGMIGRLVDGADLCMGSRFKGGIKPGAMPWKNRYIGNPVLTGILNLFFRSGIEDAHCGLRAIRREAYEALGLESTGMEFASEMVIKASLKGIRVDEVPATLSPDLRDRAPHLRPWRDGWRHLRYLFMLSPTWAFGVPAALLAGAGCVILAMELLWAFGLIPGPVRFGQNWAIVGAFSVTTGHFAALASLAGHIYSARLGHRSLPPLVRKAARVLTLEHSLVFGGLLVLLSVAGLVTIGVHWSLAGFAAPHSVLPLILATVAGAVGVQTMLAGFLLALLAGHGGRFVELPAND
ncbi:glycosyltransferase family 2 protein [Novosphingobium bradum]|uniref:Glycosyltransferase family 2 protein n=1 Tax=Novosphingobium bradum TaxID=1737444 RepID=A0ABV7IQ60_9SPHN